MTKSSGILYKLRSELAEPIQYSLRLSDENIPINPYLGKALSLRHTGILYCIQCQRKINKTFQQGYCFPCYRRLLECNLCLIHPERCKIENQPCPEHDWAHAQCAQSHVIYLANSSNLKIGITRTSQIPTRWIDQGAVQAVQLFKVSNRYRAGAIEVALKKIVADKTNWRAMLKNETQLLDLLQVKQDFVAKVQSQELLSNLAFFPEIEYVDEQPIDLVYPVVEFPVKITSFSFEKSPVISGTLLGIKGQYLIFDTGVLNIRKFGGFEIIVG